VRPVLYDFGPASLPATAPAKALPALALATLDNAGQPDGSTAVHYRLAYADARELRPYQQARWSQPPIQLMRQRLQAHLGQQRAVIGTLGAQASVRVDGQPPALLRVELEEFSQVFDSPERSVGLVRLRATLTRPGSLGESLLAQRLFEAQAPAPSPDATGGTRALAQGADQVAAALAQWLEASGY
jgi:cholesterol transport system auxiliary component